MLYKLYIVADDTERLKLLAKYEAPSVGDAKDKAREFFNEALAFYDANLVIKYDKYTVAHKDFYTWDWDPNTPQIINYYNDPKVKWACW